MRNVKFFRQRVKPAYWEWPEMLVEQSDSVPSEVCFLPDRIPGTGGIRLDLDQIEELHCRLGMHLTKHGRPAAPPPPPPVKWRDG